MKTDVLIIVLDRTRHQTSHCRTRTFSSLPKNQPSPALQAFRNLINRAEERERSYAHDDLYSLPIGSRYHPERAPIWEADASVGLTETWILNS